MISADTLAAVTAAVRLDASVAGLRSRFPALHFTECSEDDVSYRAKPVADVAGHRLFLVSGATGHCLALTNDPEAATGVLVAAREYDE
jgi:hypothetical protein